MWAGLGSRLGREAAVAWPWWCLRGSEGADSLWHSLHVPFCLITPAFPVQVIPFLLVFASFKMAFNLCLVSSTCLFGGKFIFKY